MVLTELDTIETLAKIGATGAMLSPLVKLLWPSWFLSGSWSIPIVYSGLNILLFIFTLLIGFLAAIIAFRASGFLTKMPQRAGVDLKAAGILVILVGFISLVTIPFILSGLLILIAGIESEAIWKQIRRARSQTGWPFVTVATAAGNSWTRRLSCRFCGAPLIVRSAKSRSHEIKVKTQCPLDRTTEVIWLPLSQLELWAPVLADRLHRCERCGDRTVALLIMRQTSKVTRLQASCPHGHRNRTYRKVWTPLYPHLAHRPIGNAGFQIPPLQVQFHQPRQFRLTSQLKPHRAGNSTQLASQTVPITQPIQISPSPTPSPRRDGLVQYCSQCGVSIDTSDQFCYRCGSKIH